MKKILAGSWFILLFFQISLYSQGFVIIKEILSLTEFTPTELRETAPHFPYHVEDNEVAKESLQEWAKNYPQEFIKFNEHPKYQNNKFYWYTFGIEVESEKIDEFLNDDLLRWIDIYHLSWTEVKKAAPNFPDIPNTGDKRQDAAKFNHQKVLWKELYADEYNYLMRLVYPDYNKEPSQGPHFTSYSPTTQKPIWNDGAKQNRLVYEMMLQHWYYMFDQDKYRELYGEPPTLPEEYNSMEDYIEKNTKNDN